MKAIYLPFQFKNGSVATVGDFDSIIKQQILDVLSVSNEERVMNPDYGVGAYSMIYELIDPLIWEDFKEVAMREISNNVRGVNIMDIVISSNDPEQMGSEQTSVYISVFYEISPSQKSSVTLSVSDFLSEDIYA
jgi:hypothetical protein